MRAIVTVIGQDQVGIIARVSTALADRRVNILDISQTVMQEYFTMIMLVDLSAMQGTFAELVEALNQLGRQINMSVRIQREDIFKSMHEL